MKPLREDPRVPKRTRVLSPDERKELIRQLDKSVKDYRDGRVTAVVDDEYWETLDEEPGR